MSMSNQFEVDFLNHLFLNAAIAGVGDSSGLPASATPGVLYVSLHTADPGEAGNQSTNEVTTGAYGSYVRVAVPRSSAGWTVASNQVQNTNTILFPAASSGTGATITHIGIGTSPTGTGKLLLSGPLTAPMPVALAIAPVFAAGTVTVLLD